MSYYSPDAILTDAQKLPCTFTLPLPGLGYLDGNPGEILSAGTKLELPMWLGVMLAVSNTGAAKPASSSTEGGGGGSNQQIVTLDFPEPMQSRVINALKADAKSVDLREVSLWFYGVGGRVAELFEDEEVGEVLSATFKSRAAEIADHAYNPSGALGQGVDFLRGLDETERQLFKAAHEGPKAVRQWVADLKKGG